MTLLHELFISAANTYPNRCAVFWDSTTHTSTLTFSELLKESNVIIDKLESFEVKSEYIGISAEASITYPAAVIGILRSGCAYVPLNFENFSASNLELTKKLDIRLMLTSTTHGLPEPWKILNEFNICNEVLYLVSNTTFIHKSFERMSNFIPAYAIQTSGTTGIPKIIRVPHQCIVPNVLQLRDVFCVEPGDTVFLSSPLTFDPSVVETFIALTSGGTLLIAPHHIRAAPGPSLFHFLFGTPRSQCGNVSILSVTPSYAACLLSNSSISESSAKNLHPCVKVLCLGGEPCPPITVLREWKRRLGGKTKLFSIYGITELSCWASVAEVDRNDGCVNAGTMDQSCAMLSDCSSLTVSTVRSENAKIVWNDQDNILFNVESVRDSKRCLETSNSSNKNTSEVETNKNHINMNEDSHPHNFRNISLGSPMIQTIMEVRDLNGRKIIDGKGELYLGSDTRICLVGDEDISTMGKVIFRATGDIVKVEQYRTINGEATPFMYYLGRKDGSIKRFGLWIHTKYIESISNGFIWEYCRNYTSIEASCCVWHKQNNGRGKLGLFIVPTNKEFIERSNPVGEKFLTDLTSHLLRALPSNSWPDVILPIEKMPLTHHGKADTGKLSCMMKNMLAVEAFKDVTHSTIDDSPIMKFKRLWIQYLKLSEMPSPSDHFIRSGGDSIMALRLISELEEILNHSLHPMFLSTLLTGTFKEVCALFKLKIPSPSFDCGEGIALAGISEVKQVEERPKKRIKLVESDCKSSRTEKDDIGFLSIEYRRGRTTKYKSSAEVIPMLINSDSSITFAHEWKYDLGKCIDASPVLIECDRSKQFVVVGSHSHLLVILNAETGEKISSCELPDRIESSACSSVCGKFIFVGCYDYCFYCIEMQNGKILWSFRTGNIIKSSPVIINNGAAVVFGSYDEFLYCLEMKGGTLMWKRKPGNGSIYSSPYYCYSSHIYTEGNVTENTSNFTKNCTKIILVATLGGTCAAVLESDGSILWSHEIQVPVFSSPMNIHDKALFASVKGKVICFSIISGEEMWSFQAGGNIFSSFSFLEAGKEQERIVFGCHNNFVYCLSSIGEMNWCLQLDSPIFAIPFIFPVKFICHEKTEKSENNRSHWIVVPSTKGWVYLIDIYSGNIKGNLKILSDVFSSPIVFQNYVIFGCRDNFLYCIKIT